MNRGDSLSLDVDINKDLSLYTITAWVEYGSTTISMTVTAINLALGTFNVFLTKANSALILTEDNYWNIKIEYGTDSRTIVQGNIKVIK
jgi:hypothetical protein